VKQAPPRGRPLARKVLVVVGASVALAAALVVSALIGRASVHVEPTAASPGSPPAPAPSARPGDAAPEVR
jgi:hypothetical protein